MSLNYSYKHDISYTNYNNKNLPWKVNTSYIYHNNQTINSSLKLGAIKNNLVIESSQNDIMLITPQNNKKVIAKNSMTINNDLDISNILKTNFINAKDLSLTGILHTGNLTIIGNMDLLGTFSYQGGTSIVDISESETRFRGVNFVNNSIFYDVSIINTELFLSDFSNMNIFNSHIYNSPIGYTISNNSAPAKAVFSDVSLYTLVLDSSLNSKRYIKFSNSNSNSNIIIKSSDDYSKLEISKPLNLNIGFSFEQAVTNISNINVFHGDISCVTLYYSQLVPDVKLNNYFDVSIGQVSVSGNIIPSLNNRFNIGSSNYNFNEINSNRFIGDLSGRVPYAYNLIKNLDMSFNSLDIYGTFTLKGNNLNQFLSGELNSISKGTTDFSNVNKRVRDLSISLYSKAEFDLCLNANFTKISLHDASLLVQNNSITSISASVYSKSEFDLSLNRNLLRINDVSAINDVVTYPARIYPRLGYIDSSLIKQTNAKVSNELVFPYAITYVDDNVEDTNIKESYSYKKTTNKATTTVTSAYTITYTRVWSSTYGDATLQRQPDDINHKYLILENIGSSIASLRRKWYDVLGTDPQPAVYKKVVTASGRTLISTSFELNTDNKTREQHKDQTVTLSSANVEYSLAVITNDTDNTTIKNLSPNNPAWIGGERIKTLTSTGGTKTTSGLYVIHTFTTVGSHTFTISDNVTVDYLVVAGGGSGGSGRGGGGGAGGVQTGATTLAAGSYNITVGAGGARAYANSAGNNGGSSSIGSITATGGGGGGGWGSVNGKSGGSGGGGGGRGESSQATGNGGASEGGGGEGGGGEGVGGDGGGGECGGGGGGGGASASGKDGAIGISSSLTGITKYYAGGGGGGADAGVAGVAYGGIYNDRNGTYGGGNGVPYNSNNANTYFWTYNAWTNDASTGLDSNATYTVAVTLGNTIPCTVNGVQFQANAMSGTNFSIGGEVAYYNNFGTGGVSGTGVALTPNFLYGNNRTLTLTNLTPGATYKTSFFSIGWGNGTDRNQTFIAKGISAVLNPNIYGLNSNSYMGIIINLTFIADNTGTQEFIINPITAGNTFHWHAFANRLVSTSSTPFAQYTDAVANTGGGGGGTEPGYALPSGAGGSGIVIIRYLRNLDTERGNTYWKWINGDSWSFTKWANGQPGSDEEYVKIQNDGVWHDYYNNWADPAIYMKKTYSPARSASTTYELDATLLTWEGHKTRAIQRSGNGITYTLASIIDNNVNEEVANIAGSYAKVYIGGKRKTSSTAIGRTSSDWEWSDGTTWNYTNFYEGYSERTYSASYTGGTVPSGSSTTTNRPQDANTNTPAAAFDTSTDIPETNVKLPLLVSSSNGSIIATSTAISILNLPANPSNTTSSNRNVSGFTDIDGGSNTQTLQEFTNYASNSNTNTTDYKIQKRTLKYEYDTFSYVYSYNTANNGLTSGSFKISDNSNNNSNYVKSSASDLPTTIPTTYSCIAITDDGMFVALGKASEVTVYMRNSSTSGWTTLGSPISVNFTAYTGTGVGIIPTQFTENWRKNLKNLAINFNYNTGSTTSQLLLAFGDTINIIKVYSYSNGTWTFPNGFYSVAGGSWGNTLTSYSATTLGVSATTNFGYFVTLSQSPSVLGFTVDDRFYTYNCTTTNNSIRGSAKTLPISFSNATKNIVAFKMSSDADKIIVSNTHYVFIYKWINTDFSNINTISYLASAITFNYGSFTGISAAPRSLDISNISSINNDCVFAIGFPDVIIDVSNNKKARGYVEYWKLVNNTLTRLAILVPRKRNIDSSNVDTDEYFFSAGGIKITNANTILVAPNFKFHFNSTNKKYELDTRSDTWTVHNNRSTGSRFLASIQNEVENELVKISARNNSVWIGGKRVANPINANGKTSIDWEWITSDPWIYQNFAINEPNNRGEQGVEFTNSGWTDFGTSNNRQAIFMTLPVQYSLKNTFTIFDNRFYFHSSGFSSTYCPNDVSSTVIARWYSRSTSTNPTNSNTINFSADGKIVSRTKGALTLSDIRLKENIVDTTPKLADLLKVRVVNYNLKGSDGKKLIGVIAQELEQLFPSLVKDGELSLYDINHGKTESYKSVKYSCFDIILIKAFQEQMAIINKLSSQLDEIEGKTKILKAISEDNIILNEELALLKSENELFKLNINEILKLI